MKLSIDTTKEKAIIKVSGKTIKFNPVNIKREQKVLIEIEQLLIKQSIELSKISMIEINTGPGPFTSVRVGVSIANALSRVLGIPVCGLNEKKELDVVAPCYDRPANVTRR